MFANVGWGEMLVLVIIGLVVLGPERLPGAIRWSAGALRQAREYVSKATGDLREDLGPDFDDLREPLSELNKLRGMTPRAAITKHLLDGDESLFGSFDDARSTVRDSTAEFNAAVNGELDAPAGPAPSAETSSVPGPAPTKFDPDAT